MNIQREDLKATSSLPPRTIATALAVPERAKTKTKVGTSASYVAENDVDGRQRSRWQRVTIVQRTAMPQMLSERLVTVFTSRLATI